MFLALDHSAQTAVHALVALAVFLEAAVSSIIEISLSDKRGKKAWSTAVVPVFC